MEAFGRLNVEGSKLNVGEEVKSKNLTFDRKSNYLLAPAL